MATSTTFARSHAGEIKFAYGVPEVFSLKFLEPKSFDGQFGPRAMFTAADEGYGERKIWLDHEAASNICEELRRLGIQVGEPVRVTKIKHPRGGGSGFLVARAAQAQAAPEWVTRDEARAVPTRMSPMGSSSMEAQLAQSVAMVRQHGPQVFRQPAIAQPEANQNEAAIAPGTGSLAGALKAAIDSVLESTAYAARRGLELAFTTEDIRALAITAYIGQQKGGR
jgi:hypothetical protein